MVEREFDASGQSGVQKADTIQKDGKVYREKKRFPPLEDMLAYGAPESRDSPKTFWDMVKGPLILVILFVLSFHIFINAPHEHTKGPERQANGFAMNQKPNWREREQENIKAEQSLTHKTLEESQLPTDTDDERPSSKTESSEF